MNITLTIIKYPKKFTLFALAAMAIFRFPFWLNKNISFYKLMGSGKNGGFDKTPNWQQWAILIVDNFNDINENDIKLKTSFLYIRFGIFITKWLKIFNCKSTTYWLSPTEGKGFWDNKNVFGQLPITSNYDGEIAVLTRATIKVTKVISFWKNVKPLSLKLNAANGLIKSYGIGELPFIKQAPFSIWENKEALKTFAYKMMAHKNVINKTKKEGWYSEEMFVRFKILTTLEINH